MSVSDKEKKSNRVIIEDCLNALRKFPDDTFDACITDPPYNISGAEARKKI